MVGLRKKGTLCWGAKLEVVGLGKKGTPTNRIFKIINRVNGLLGALSKPEILFGSFEPLVVQIISLFTWGLRVGCLRSTRSRIARTKVVIIYFILEFILTDTINILSEISFKEDINL